MADEEAVAWLLDMAKKKKHSEVKARLAVVSKETSKVFKERYRLLRHGNEAPSSNNNNNSSSNSSSSKSSTSRRTGKAVVLQAWTQDDSTLSLKENDVVDVLSFASSEWCRVQFGRTKGAVPASFLKLLPTSGLRSVVAVHVFDSQKPGHLPFKRDDQLVVVDELEGWMRGFMGTRFGRWPSSYVRELSVEETEEQILLMGLQAEAPRKDKDKDRRKPPPPSARPAAHAAQHSDSDDDADDASRTLDTAIFRPDSGGGGGSRAADSDDSDDDARSSALKKTQSMPAFAKPPGHAALSKSAAASSIAPPSKPPPPASAPPGSVPVDAVTTAIHAVIDGGDVDAATTNLPAAIVAALAKLKQRAGDVQRRADETSALAASLQTKAEQQEVQTSHQLLRVKALEARAAELDQRDAALVQRAAKLDVREQTVAAREEAVRVAMAELRQRNKAAPGPAAATAAAEPEPPAVRVPTPEPPVVRVSTPEPLPRATSGPLPPVPEEDETTAPPPLPEEPAAPALVAADSIAVSPTQAVPLTQYLALRDAQGWSEQPPLPASHNDGRARAVHDAARSALYGAGGASGGGGGGGEFRAVADSLLDAIAGGSLDAVRDAALRFVAAAAAMARGRDDVLRAVRCVVENTINVLVFGEDIADGHANAADANMAYATSIANVNDMFERLVFMAGLAAPTQERKLNLSARVASARRQSFVTVMRAMPEADEDDDEEDEGVRAFEACAATDVGQFFKQIIDKHGARFPAVQEELTRRLPVLVNEAHVSTVEQLLALDKERLAELKFSPQLVMFVRQLGAKHIASRTSSAL